MIAWLDGDFITAEQAALNVQDRGFLLGDGVFETLRVCHGQVDGPADHLNRMAKGAGLLEIPFELTSGQVSEIAVRLARENALQNCNAVLRLTLTRGPGGRGLDFPASAEPTCLMTIGPLGPAPSDMRAAISDIRRNEHSPLSRIKSLNYLDNILARRQAAKSGAKEAIMLNTAGMVACAAAANIFIVEDRSVITPQIADGALPGTMRARIISLGSGIGLTVTEATISPERLMSADEVFLTNSLLTVCSVVDIAGKKYRRTNVADLLVEQLRPEIV